MAPKRKAKAKPKAMAGSSKDKKPLTKGILKNKGGKKKVMKMSLKKKNLAKLGKMTLQQKVDKATEHAETPEEAAQELKTILTKDEHSKVWSKHKTYLKGLDAKERAEFDKLSKNEKGLKAALYLIQNSSCKFMLARQGMSHEKTLDKREQWKSETKMIEEHGWEEFYSHIQSGRIQWRPDPWTPNVYNYRDLGDEVKVTTYKQHRSYEKGSEFVPSEDDLLAWNDMWNMDAHSHAQIADGWGKGKAKGKGKSKAKALTKGMGKGTRRREPLAIEDGNVWDDEDDPENKTEEEEPEEKQWKEIMSKAKRARDQASSAKADCEAALSAADKSKRLTKVGKKEAEDLMASMVAKVQVVKTLMAKGEKAMSLTKAKALLVEVSGLVKEVKNEQKELNQLASKAGSKASTKR